MIKVEYVRDMHKNYLVLQGLEGKVSVYSVKMLLYNNVPGLLSVELRCIDHLDLFYYDVTSKKTIETLYESKSLNYEEMHYLISNILQAIEQANEYLLLENDYIIDPNFIYMDSDTKIIYLCHLVGYQINIQEQLIKFVEYLMNKVDYKDDKAVLLIYAIYKVCRDSDCTFDKIKNELGKQFVKNKDINNKDIYNEDFNNKDLNKTINNNVNSKVINNNIKDVNNKKIYEKNSNNIDFNKDSNDIDRIRYTKRKANIIDSKNKSNIQDNKSNNQNNKIEKKAGNFFKQTSINEKTYKTKNQGINYSKTSAENNNKNNILTRLIKNMNEVIEHGLLKINPCKISSEKINQTNQLNKQNHKYEPILEEIESEKEMLYYGKKTYILAIVSLIIGIILIGVVYSQRLLHNTFGTRLDPVKVISCIMIIGCLQAYVMLQLFQKKNKLVKIVPYTEYAEPGEFPDKSMIENGVSMVSAGDCNVIYDQIANTIDKDQEEDSETQLLWTNQDDYDDKTVILADLSNKVDSYLIPFDLDDNKKIPISEYPFVIGKSGNSVNYIINEKGISRLHAKITKDGDNYYLVDLASTNGTYINGLKIKENIPYIINDKDEIVFSKIKFSWMKTF
jgi:hypothetical protein